MGKKDLVSEEVLQELITKLEEIINNYCHNLEYFSDSEVDDFFQASADEVTFYNGLINDKIESQNFLWSSKHVAEKIAQSIIEANGYTDNMIKNIASIKLKYVTSLPTSDISENTIYILKASDGTSKDTLNLYNATDGWTSIGEFNISLDDYYDKTEIDTKLDLKANKTEVVANDKIVQTLDSTTNSSDTVLSTSGLQVELNKKANDDEVIKKTSLVTTIDSSSTEEEVPSAKTIYEKTKNMCTTSVADVGKTNITYNTGQSDYEALSNNETNFYSITNGICQCSIHYQTNVPNPFGTWTNIITGLPKPKNGFYNVVPAYNGGAVCQVYLSQNGTLEVSGGTNGSIYLYTFSYPVAEN